MRAVRPLRVLLTCDAVGGVWSFAMTLSQELTARGVTIDLAVLGPPPDAVQRTEAHRVRDLQLHVLPFQLEWEDRSGLEVPALREALVELALRTNADIVHVNGYREAAFGFSVPVVLTGHSCVASWWQACRNAPPPADWDRYLSALRLGIQAADVVTAPTHVFMTTLQTMHVRPRYGSMVHNGVATSRTASRGDRQPFILCAGRLWDEAKNIAILEQVAPGIPWPILVAGEGASGPALQALGRLSQPALHALMDDASIFCSPARYEPFGLAVLEAAQRGAALVLADLPTFRELWHDAALFVDPTDAAALAHALRDLIADPRRLAAMAGLARTRSASFSASAMASRYHELYCKLAPDLAAAATP